MSAVSRGNSAERYVAKRLRDAGWLVGSLRHSKGAGDLIALWPHATNGNHPADGVTAVKTGKTLLIECKRCKELWQQFRREDRQAMRNTPLSPGGERWVVNKRGNELIWMAEKDWP